MKKIFRLALIRQKYRPDGGAERFITRVLSVLKNCNIDLSIITREWQHINDDNYNIYICDPPKYGRISRDRGFAKLAKILWKKEQFDLIQSHERIPGCEIYRAGDGVHFNWLKQYTRLLPKWQHQLLFLHPYHRYVMKTESLMYAAPELQAVICNSKMIKKEIIEQFKIPVEKISVIYNAIDSNKFKPANENIKQQIRLDLQLPLHAHCLIFVGSGFARKGLEVAIKAISRTNSYLLVIGQDKHENKYRALSVALSYQNRIRFMGMQKNIVPFYQAADGLLLPTLYDPFPNSILEAMACGLPVITSYSCGGCELIQEGKNGFITDALDIYKITTAIQELPRQALGSVMSQCARNTILSYNLYKLSKQYMKLYRQLLIS